MKRGIIFIVLALVMVLVAAKPGRSSSGAPVAHTGAPGEQTCAEGGCHDDNGLNSGKAQLEISLLEDAAKIEAGKTYHLKVKISDENVTRFGFQLVALDQGNDNCGTFKVTDISRTQKLESKKLNRSYITYTFDGTDAVYKGAGEWTVEWKAPEKMPRNVTFYAAAVSGNDDMSDKGDKVYTHHLKFKRR
jgi:hypothetical protein